MRVKLHGGRYNYGRQESSETWTCPVSYRYESLSQLDRYKYETIVKMLQGGWVDFDARGNVILTRINEAYPDVHPNVIKEIASKESINKTYAGYM